MSCLGALFPHAQVTGLAQGEGARVESIYFTSASCPGDRTQCREAGSLKPIYEAVRLLPTSVHTSTAPSLPGG